MPVMIWTLKDRLPMRADFVTKQQRPRSTGWLPIPKKPVLPWELVHRSSEPRVVHQLMPNLSLMPLVQTVSPALAGGMAGLLILTLRTKLQQASLLKTQPVPQKPTLPWRRLHPVTAPLIIHSSSPLPATPSNFRRRRFSKGWTRQ